MDGRRRRIGADRAAATTGRNRLDRTGRVLDRDRRLALGSKVHEDLPAVAAAYVLILAIAGPILARLPKAPDEVAETDAVEPA